MTGIKETILKRSGTKKLIRHVYLVRDQAMMTRYYIETPIPGKRNAYHRHWFDHEGTAERSLGGASGVNGGEWWDLGALRRSNKRVVPETRKESWRLPR